MIFTGNTGKICIYDHNGVQYAQSQEIQTSDSGLNEMSIYEDMSGFLFGGDSNTFSVYEFAKGNGSYELIHQESIGEEVFEINVDP